VRRPYIAGNWKMHLDRRAVDDFCAGLRQRLADPFGCRLGIFPPVVYLARVVDALAGSGVTVGAQTCHPAAQGAFTGEVSARMLADVGADAVIVGHSERRQLFGETDADVRARLDAGLAAGLDVILCVGETLAERQAGQTFAVVRRQLDAGLSGLAAETLARHVTIAYEPVWAIGTGHTATPAQAQEVHAALRAQLGELAGERAAGETIIQYGGSVKPANAAELMDCPDVDGALVGGASLELPSFEAIARFDRQGADR
jgi:triosephosphate isomerase